ncbi:MAG: class I SAM-dependent methyltransferase [Tepidisphaeraceae bacterium]
MAQIPDDILTQIRELDALAKTRNDAWQISREEGEMLHQTALSTGAKTIVEIGTSYGFSGLFWGAAMRVANGHVHTIDKDPRKVQMSRETFRKAHLDTIITNHQGDAADVLASLEGPFDLVFIDADKDRCRAYFDLVWPKLRTGGSILTDNASTHRAELAEYVAYLRDRKDASSAEVAVGNGVEWTIKLL